MSRGKAGEIADALSRAPSPEEMERRGGLRPKLRLRPEVLAQAIEAEASVGDVLHRQTAEGEDLTVLHDAESGVAAVAIPVERYLELVTSEMKARPNFVAGLEGNLGPSDDTLGSWGVEQVNPGESWVRVGTPQ